jgi:hypothetical protein
VSEVRRHRLFQAEVTFERSVQGDGFHPARITVLSRIMAASDAETRRDEAWRWLTLTMPPLGPERCGNARRVQGEQPVTVLIREGDAKARAAGRRFVIPSGTELQRS